MTADPPTMDDSNAIVGLGEKLDDFGTIDDSVAAAAASAADAAASALAANVVNVKVFAGTASSVAHGNPVTVTGIEVGDTLLAILKDTTPNWAVVDVSDATIGADTLTFTATDFAASDNIVVFYIDLTP